MANDALSKLRYTTADPVAGAAPSPQLLLHMEHRRIVYHCNLATAPEWVKPILLIALRDPGE